MPQQTDSSLDPRVLEARRIFQRVLVGWASDLLEVRRLGLEQPVWHAACNEDIEAAPRAAA